MDQTNDTDTTWCVAITAWRGRTDIKIDGARIDPSTVKGWALVG
ncbi:hypothetical protein [Streptomyces endocoffeicus]|nr:hypothetical protein [Streptomyces endocoffeicus]